MAAIVKVMAVMVTNMASVAEMAIAMAAAMAATTVVVAATKTTAARAMVGGHREQSTERSRGVGVNIVIIAVTIAVYVAIAVSIVPFLVDCCFSPPCHCCCYHCL